MTLKPKHGDMNPDIELKFGMAGRYKLDAHKVDADGNIISSRVAADWFDNLITDFGLNNIGKTTSFSKVLGVVVGTGNTAPAFSDTNLAAYKAGTATLQVAWAGTSQHATTPYYQSYTVTFRFATGAAAGNLTEIGMAGDGSNSTLSSTSKLFSRALIVDGSGNPTTITIQSDEILDVTYELRVYLPNSGNDITGSFNQTIDGVSTAFAYTLRAANVGAMNNAFAPWGLDAVIGTQGVIATLDSNYNNLGGVSNAGLGAITSYPSQTTSSAWSSVSTATYVDSSLYSDLTYNLALNAANFVINSVWVVCLFRAGFQMSLTPGVTKVATKTYFIKFRFSWSRY